MAQYHNVAISVTQYGTVSNCLDTSNKIWLCHYMCNTMVQYHVISVT